VYVLPGTTVQPSSSAENLSKGRDQPWITGWGLRSQLSICQSQVDLGPLHRWNGSSLQIWAALSQQMPRIRPGGSKALIKASHLARHLWFTPVILATQEAEIRRIMVQSQPWQIVCKTLSRKNPSQKRAGGVAQGIGLEFKPQYCQRKKPVIWLLPQPLLGQCIKILPPCACL
jgi:hypothetical protein